jgi:hypothetical protein
VSKLGLVQRYMQVGCVALQNHQLASISAEGHRRQFHPFFTDSNVESFLQYSQDAQESVLSCYRDILASATLWILV